MRGTGTEKDRGVGGKEGGRRRGKETHTHREWIWNHTMSCTAVVVILRGITGERFQAPNTFWVTYHLLDFCFSCTTSLDLPKNVKRQAQSFQNQRNRSTERCMLKASKLGVVRGQV